MKNQFVTYEIALKLKELGFNEPCFMIFNENETLEECVNVNTYKLHLKDYNNFIGLSNVISAPLYQQAIDWLREEHKIRVCNIVDIHNECCFIVYHSTDADIIKGNDFYKTREEAILKAIEIDQNNK